MSAVVKLLVQKKKWKLTTRSSTVIAAAASSVAMLKLKTKIFFRVHSPIKSAPQAIWWLNNVMIKYVTGIGIL